MRRSHPSHPPPTAASPLGALEVDARSVGANFGRVALYLALGPATEHYLVRIETDDGEPVATIAADTRADALDAYRHPFARPGVPDVFGEAA